jgi:hypothetical protein
MLCLTRTSRQQPGVALESNNSERKREEVWQVRQQVLSMDCSSVTVAAVPAS